MQRHLIGLGTICWLLAGCGELSGSAVQMSRRQTMQLLYDMPDTIDLTNFPLQGRNASKIVERSNEGVVWVYQFYGKPICRFTIHIKEQSERSSVVWTTLEEVGGDPPNLMCQAAKIVGEESVAATLEGRAVNRVEIEQQIAALPR